MSVKLTILGRNRPTRAGLPDKASGYGFGISGGGSGYIAAAPGIGGIPAYDPQGRPNFSPNGTRVIWPSGLDFKTLVNTASPICSSNGGTVSFSELLNVLMASASAPNTATFQCNAYQGVTASLNYSGGSVLCNAHVSMSGTNVGVLSSQGHCLIISDFDVLGRVLVTSSLTGVLLDQLFKSVGGFDVPFTVPSGSGQVITVSVEAQCARTQVSHQASDVICTVTFTPAS